MISLDILQHLHSFQIKPFESDPSNQSCFEYVTVSGISFFLSAAVLVNGSGLAEVLAVPGSSQWLPAVLADWGLTLLLH